MKDKESCRKGYGQAIVELGRRNKKVVALSADLSPSVKMKDFKKEFPSRYFDVGVAEQNLVTVASGLSHVGKIPFISSFGAFCPGRCWEQIRTTICYNNAKVNIVSTHNGLNVGEDGATHQMLEDISLMRSLPNINVIVPCDYNQTKKATKELAKTNSPSYMRLGRYKSPVITNSKTPFRIGKANIYRKGKDVAIIACGPLVNECLIAADNSEASVRVIDMHTIKPLDKAKIRKAARECNGIITVEDHQINGGLGGAVSEVADCKVIRMGVDDQFGESGKAEELLEKHNLTHKYIEKEIKKLCASAND